MTPHAITIKHPEHRPRLTRRRPALGANNPRRRPYVKPPTVLVFAKRWAIEYTKDNAQ